MKGRAKEKESLPGWAADVILKRLEQKWGGSGKQTIDLSLYSPSLAFLSISHYFFSVIVASLLKQAHKASGVSHRTRRSMCHGSLSL